MTPTDQIRFHNVKALTGKLRPSGRFSVCQLNPSRTKVLNHVKADIKGKEAMRTVQQIDEAYDRLRRGVDADVHAVRPPNRGSKNALGLSNATNSNTRAKRGSKGISSRQRDLLCWGANSIESVYGRRNLSFLTLTLPDLSDRDFESVRENWKEIVHYCQQQIKRELKKHGITTSIAGCTELQMERAEDSGRFYPHLHLVFRGRKGVAYHWAVEPHVFRALWSASVGRFLLDPVGTWEASENVQPVRKSVGGYLAKYISKCASKSAPDSLNQWHPSDWILVSRGIRGLYEKFTYSGYECGRLLLDVVTNWKAGIGYKRPIVIKSTAYGERVIGQYGWLKGETVFPNWEQLHPFA